MKKWRNKITGEIKEFMVHKRIEDSEDGNPVYVPFNGRIDEWEDAPEEPKKYWYVYGEGVLSAEDNNGFGANTLKAIGNYFETREEAEKAVEKLKAWKRLKDKGFEIESWTIDVGDNYYKSGQIQLNLNNVRNRSWDEFTQITEIKKDLDLLFGGEE